MKDEHLSSRVWKLPRLVSRKFRKRFEETWNMLPGNKNEVLGSTSVEQKSKVQNSEIELINKFNKYPKEVGR